MATRNQTARKAVRVAPRVINTPPSPSDALVGPLFGGYSDLGAMVLEHMDPVDRSFLAGASKSIGDAVMKSENPSDASKPLAVAGVTPGIGLKVFTDSFEKFRFGYLTYPKLLRADKDRHSGSHGMVCSMAVSKGNLDVLREARAIGCPWGNTAINACLNGHLQILKWARGPFQSDRLQLKSRCYTVAAGGGHLDVIKFLHEEQCAYDHKAPHEAARSGHSQCLKLLYDIYRNGEGWGWWPDRVCAFAVTSGRIDVLKTAWVLEPHSYDAENQENPFLFFNVAAMQQAAEIGRIDMMEWLLDNGCPWGSYTCQAIADAGDPAVSIWAAEAPNGCRCNSPFGPTMTSKCSVHGDPWI